MMKRKSEKGFPISKHLLKEVKLYKNPPSGIAECANPLPIESVDRITDSSTKTEGHLLHVPVNNTMNKFY